MSPQDYSSTHPLAYLAICALMAFLLFGVFGFAWLVIGIARDAWEDTNEGDGEDE